VKAMSQERRTCKKALIAQLRRKLDEVLQGSRAVFPGQQETSLLFGPTPALRDLGGTGDATAPPHGMNLMLLIAPVVGRWCPKSNAGAMLHRLEARGDVAVLGDDPATCLVELRQPVLPEYADTSCIPMEAWLAAWRVQAFSHHDRHLAIQQDLTQFRAGLLVLAQLVLRDEDLVSDVVTRARFDEAVAVAHQ
jgi:hypothetical protein